MADTALSKKEVKEYFDSKEKILEDVKKLVSLLKSQSYCVMHTGAGISTSSGIADFRGPDGVWTLEAQGKKYIPKTNAKMPTLTHMAIKKLMDVGYIKYLVSQNVDGLHVKSGIPLDKIAELHGNDFIEYCKKCNKKYFRNFSTCKGLSSHETGRKCECGGKLYDSIIHFSESLPQDALENAIRESKKCDLSVILGTSLRVGPACHIPFENKKNSNIAIVNLQKTPYDDVASIRVHTKTDDFMELVMKELYLEIPDFIFEFNFDVVFQQPEKSSVKISNSSTDLSEILTSLSIIDSKLKESFINSKYEVNVKNYTIGDELQLKLSFNLLNPFDSIIKINKSCRVFIQLNTFKSSLEYNLV